MHDANQDDSQTLWRPSRREGARMPAGAPGADSPALRSAPGRFGLLALISAALVFALLACEGGAAPADLIDPTLPAPATEDGVSSQLQAWIEAYLSTTEHVSEDMARRIREGDFMRIAAGTCSFMFTTSPSNQGQRVVLWAKAMSFPDPDANYEHSTEAPAAYATMQAPEVCFEDPIVREISFPDGGYVTTPLEVELGLPWSQDVLEDFGYDEIEIYASLLFLRDNHPEVYSALLQMPWINGPILVDHIRVVTGIMLIAEELPPEEIPAFGRLLSESDWLLDGIDSQDVQYLEEFVRDSVVNDPGLDAAAILDELRAGHSSGRPGPGGAKPSPPEAYTPMPGELDLPWSQDGLDLPEEIETHANLVFLRDNHPEVFSAFLQMPWMNGPIVRGQFLVVSLIRYIAEELPPEEIPPFGRLLSESDWLLDGIDSQDVQYLEEFVGYSVVNDPGLDAAAIVDELRAKAMAGRVPTAVPAQAGSLVDLRWARDFSDLTSDERLALRYLEDIYDLNSAAFAAIIDLPWLADSIAGEEMLALEGLYSLVERFPEGDPELAQAISEASWLKRSVGPAEANYAYDLSSIPENRDLVLAHLRRGPVASAPTPTPAPRPTLGPRVAVADLAWAGDGLTGPEQQALADLRVFDQRFPELAAVILRYSWVADGITGDEQQALEHLLTIARGGSLRARSSSSLPASLYQQLVNAMPRHEYLMDGITPNERQFLRDVSDIPEEATMVAAFFADEPGEDYSPAAPTPAPTPTPQPRSGATDFPWAQDGLTALEREAVGYLQQILDRDRNLRQEVLEKTWLADGIDEPERRYLCLLATDPALVNDIHRALVLLLTTGPSPDTPDCPSAETQ